MSPLRNRIASLEGRNGPRGPLLFSWRMSEGGRATAIHNGQTYTQGVNEPRDAFFQRLTENIPSRTVVWVNELDEKL